MTPTIRRAVPRITPARPHLPPSLRQEFVDCDTTLVFDYQVPAGETLVGLQQPISSEGDFFLCAIQASSVIQARPDLQLAAGNVGLRFADDTGYRLMDDYVNLYFFSEMQGNPWPYVVKPMHRFRAGTKILVDIEESTGFLSNVQVAFRGVYRYYRQTR